MPTYSLPLNDTDKMQIFKDVFEVSDADLQKAASALGFHSSLTDEATGDPRAATISEIGDDIRRLIVSRVAKYDEHLAQQSITTTEWGVT